MKNKNNIYYSFSNFDNFCISGGITSILFVQRSLFYIIISKF